MKFAPNAPDVDRRRPSRIFATYSGGAAPIPLTIPSPPASATAAARAGEAILPIPACCNGTVHPSNSVNFVWSIATPEDANVLEPFSDVDCSLPKAVSLPRPASRRTAAAAVEVSTDRLAHPGVHIREPLGKLYV